MYNRSLLALSLFIAALIQIGIVIGYEYPAIEKPLITHEVVEPKCFGNGTWYFDCTGQKFMYSLSAFIGKHPGIEIAALGKDDRGMITQSNGFIVIAIGYECDRIEKPVVPHIIVNPMYFGNGTWYFDCTGQKFMYSLSAFIGKHRGLMITSLESDDRGMITQSNGFVVTTKEIPSKNSN